MITDSITGYKPASGARRSAILAGVFYFLTFLLGGVAQFASSGLLVSGNPMYTAANLLARERRFWLGFAAYLLVVACYVAVTAFFYELSKPANRTLSLLAAFFSLVGCAIQACACFFYIIPLLLVKGMSYRTLGQEQLQGMAYICFNFYTQLYSIGFPFFGFYCCLIGYLVFKSMFLPRILGVLMMCAGFGWLTFVVPPLANSLWPYVAIPGIVGEGSLTIWLLTKGKDV
ncbi:MAG: DUF4386 domain-containing protein [Acidobacteria bacterium]|nr:DUF4386 domain-containing protein [Acidobacteriota bacterium]